MDTEAGEAFLVGSSPCISITHSYQEKLAWSMTPLGVDNWKLLLGVLLDPAHVPLPLADFNLYLFVVISHIYGYNRF